MSVGSLAAALLGAVLWTECPVDLPPALATWTHLYLEFESPRLEATSGDRVLTPSAVRGPVAFAAGLRGNALRIGRGAPGAQVDFPRRLLRFDRPGSLSFWVSPESWHSVSDAYVPFLVAGGVGRASFNLQRDYRKDGDERILAGMFSLPHGRSHFLRVRTVRWQPGSWHLVAMRWDRVSFGLSLDGGAFVQQGIPEGEWQRSFGPRATRAVWRVGGAGAEATLVDELRFFHRGLRGSEVREMFEAGRACHSEVQTGP